MRKFCQNLQNAQLFRPKTGILSAFLPSAAGQNSDTFPVLHTVERGVSLQGREKIGDVPRKRPRPLRHSLRRATSPKGRALGSPRKLHLFAKASPFGRGVTAGDGEGEDADHVQQPYSKNSFHGAAGRGREKAMGLPVSGWTNCSPALCRAMFPLNRLPYLPSP